MNNSESFLNEVKNITGIKDLNSLSQDDAQKILEFIAEKKLTEKHIEALVQNYPHFIQAEIEALKTIQKVAEGAENSQSEVLKSISKSIEGVNKILEKLADKSQDDKTRVKIAELTIEVSELYLEFAQINRDINKDNNSFWIKIASIAGAVLFAAAMILLGSIGGSGSNKDSDS